MTANPFLEMAKAARGDLDAQRALARMACDVVAARPNLDPESILREGLVFARLAAEHGNDGDHGMVISMLALHARTVPDEEQGVVLGEALARYSALVARGVEVPGLPFEELVAHAPPDVVANAIHFQQAMNEEVPA
jgi:hypothetical protein